MEHYTLDEAAIKLGQKTDYLQKIILFDDKPHPILKPCVFFTEPISVRILNQGVNSTCRSKRLNIEHTMKRVKIDTLDSFALQAFEYTAAKMQGLFELTFYPEHMDMTETKKSGRIQLYREKAVFSHLTNSAVQRIMNNRYAAMTWEAKVRTRDEVGDMVILTKDNLHCLVDAPNSISLADIRITDRMLTEFAVSVGITLAKNQADQKSAFQAEGSLVSKEISGIKAIRREYYTPHELAEYWRNAMGLKVYDSDVDHYIEAGKLKISVRYETHQGYWWDEDDPELICLYNPLNPNAMYREPAVRKLFVRLKEAERFEKEYFLQPTHKWIFDRTARIERKKRLFGIYSTKLMQSKVTISNSVPSSPSVPSAQTHKDASQAFDLLAYVTRCKTAKQSDEQICYDLVTNYGQSKKHSKPNSVRLSALAIGIAVFPNHTHGSMKEKDALERHVWRKVEACLKIVTK